MIRKSGNRFPNEEIGLGAIIAGDAGTIGFQKIPKSTRMPHLGRSDTGPLCCNNPRALLLCSMLPA